MPVKPPRPAERVIAVGSGKGGVGKSTVALNLALALSAAGANVGVLDGDIDGPNIPLMLGIKKHKATMTLTLARQSKEKLYRPFQAHGLEVMSMGFLIAEDQTMAVPAETIDLFVRQLIADVAWGPLDFLIVDLPPGTATVLQSLHRHVDLTAAVVVVTPQDVAHLDARRALTTYKRLGVPIAGGVENMAGSPCPHCGQLVETFARVPWERSIWASGVEKLGSIPSDFSISQAGDAGVPLMVAHSGSAAAGAFREAASILDQRTRAR